ncbi:MAG: DNA-directed RNA polymerase subunit alpha [Candidatus Niyogibacteria bacterium]|nr:DNA-directed RNA polymerase subunit alpha [Candidatus Niyogibacteria bacterium]
MEIILPSKPKIIEETEFKGVYEIEGLYPGYGHTLGNSLRRILLSSLPGAAIITVKISGVEHEFSTIEGVKEDVINILLNLKNIRLKIHAEEPQILTLRAEKQKKITAKDIKTPSQVEIINKDAPIATLTSKNSKLNAEIVAIKGIGYVPREMIVKDKVEVGTMVLDAIFTPIKKVNYEVENMRVGDRTDFNRLRISLQTDGTISPKEAFESAVNIMIKQLKAISGWKESEMKEDKEAPQLKNVVLSKKETPEKINPVKFRGAKDLTGVKIEDLNLSSRILSALKEAGIKTIGGLTKKKEENLLKIEGFGKKALEEIKESLNNLGLSLKE